MKKMNIITILKGLLLMSLCLVQTTVLALPRIYIGGELNTNKMFINKEFIIQLNNQYNPGYSYKNSYSGFIGFKLFAFVFEAGASRLENIKVEAYKDNNRTHCTIRHSNFYSDLQAWIPAMPRIDLIGSVGIEATAKNYEARTYGDMNLFNDFNFNLRLGLGGQLSLSQNFMLRLMGRYQFIGNVKAYKMTSIGLGGIFIL